MKYFQIILILFLIFITGNKVSANFITEYHGFYALTLGAHTFFQNDDGNDLYGGAMGYFGMSMEETGIGILASYEQGSTKVKGYKFKSQIGNLSLSLSANSGNSLLIVSRGISKGILTLNDRVESGSGETYSLHYVYRFPEAGCFIKNHVMAHLRTQGQGIMFSIGFGSGF